MNPCQFAVELTLTESELTALRERNKAIQLKLAADNADLQRSLETARGQFQLGVARINASAAGADKAQNRVDKKDLGEAIQFIGKTALSLPDLIKSGKTPDQIEKVVRVTLDGLTLTPEARKTADAYFAQEVGPALHDAAIQQQNSAMDAGPMGSPPPDTSFNLTNWMNAHGMGIAK